MPLDVHWKTVRTTMVGIGVIGALLGTVTRGLAQDAQSSYKLTVRPQSMATGTENPAAGEYPLDSVPDAILSVAPSCTGAHRCPLLVFLPGAGQPAQHITNWLRPATDKYGILLLAPTTYDPTTLDAVLREVVRRFAVDPGKIAIIGRCASGMAGTQFGVKNLAVFSRIGAISGGAHIEGLDLATTTAEFYFDTGINEVGGSRVMPSVKALRQAGRSVKHIVGLRGHEDQVEDYEFLGRWLHESWTRPVAARTAPVVVADPVPVLTLAAMRQLTAFWAAFAQEPDSIRTVARRATLREVVVPVGGERSSVVMMDLPALAARYPSVAAALKQAGLTAAEHEAYRVALISASATQTLKPEGLDPASPLAKNLAFLEQYPDELQALAQAGFAHPEGFADLGGTLSSDTTTFPGVVLKPSIVRSPAATAALGSMGIWRTP